MKIGSNKSRAYRVVCLIILIVLAFLFLFPLYWILTGALKPTTEIYATTPSWFPKEWTLNNFDKLFNRRSAPLFELTIPFSGLFNSTGTPVVWLTGPTVPGAIRWLVNTVFMAAAAMLLTCITATMAGYALAKKRFVGRALLFSPAKYCRPLQWLWRLQPSAADHRSSFSDTVWQHSLTSLPPPNTAATSFSPSFYQCPSFPVDT